jgi:hypothetical protein
MITEGYDRCRQRKAPSMPNHERNLYHPEDSDNDPCRDIRATGMDVEWSIGSEVGIWRTGSLLDVFLFLPFLPSLLGHRPSINGVGMGFCHVQSRSSGGGFSPCTRSAERPPRVVPIGSGTYEFVRVRTWHDYFCVSITFLSYSRTELCSPGGLHLKRGIM